MAQPLLLNFSPFGVIFLGPVLVAGFVHEHAIFEEHAVGEPPHEESDWENDEVLPVLPGDDRDEDPHEGHVEESSLRIRIPHC